jgi:hypothetical protein
VRRGTGVSAGLVALLALFVHMQAPQSPEPSSGRDAGASGSTGDNTSQNNLREPEEPHVDGPWIATEAYFHEASSVKHPQPKPSTSQARTSSIEEVHASLIRELVSEGGRPNKEDLKELLGLPKDEIQDRWSIVATVADPLHTRMSLYFDGQTEAIERSLQESGWEFAGQWLPSSTSATPREKGINSVRRHSALQRAAEEMPGILIFRSKLKLALNQQEPGTFPDDVLFVLLVPETVTGGANGPAFYAAMHIADVLSTHEIGLLAPTFSGSFASLTTLVNSWERNVKHEHGFHRTIYSGEVANFESANAFAQATKMVFHDGGFDSLSYQKVVCQVMAAYRVETDFAALLREDEGGLTTSLSANPGKDPNCRFRTYVFPRDIAHLRNAYQEATGNSTQAIPESSPGMSFSIKDPSTGEDSIPVFSEVQTPLTQNAIISSITRDLNRAHTRIVFIVATNSLDALFLMRAVRRDCPNARILVENPHILFVPAAASDPLSGTLLLSTYPMFFNAPEGEFGKGARSSLDNVMFQESTLNGLFNVTRILAHEIAPEHDPKQFMLRGNARPNEAGQHPAVWLLMLTPFGFFPIDLFDPEPRKLSGNPAADRYWFKDAKADVFPVSETIKPPRSWAVTIFILSAATLLGCVVLVQRNLTKQRGKPVWLVLSDRFRPRLEALTGACFALSALIWIVALPGWLPLETFFLRDQRGLFLFLNLISVAAFLAPLGSLLLILRSRSDVITRDRIRGMGLRNQVCAALFCLAAAVVFVDVLVQWYLLCQRHRPNYSLFFRYRALDLFSGSSPALPLALISIGVFAASLITLKRHSVAGAGRVRLAFPQIISGDPSAPEAGNTFQDRMKRSYLEMNRRAAFDVALGDESVVRVVLCATLVAGCFSVLFTYAAAFELPAYNYLLLPGLAMLLFCLAAACYDLFYLWASLEKFLRLVELFPMQAAFKRVAREWPRRPIWASRRAVSAESVDRQMLYALHRRKVILSTRENEKAMVAQAGAGSSSTTVMNEEFRSMTTAQEALEQLGEFSKIALATPADDAQAYAATLQKQQEISARIAAEVYGKDLVPAWRASLNEEDDLPAASSAQEQRDQKYLQYCADFVALQFCRYVGYSVGQIQRLASGVSLSFLLLIVLSNSYRPQGPQFVAQTLAVLFVIIGAVVARVFARMERNPILSKIARSQPGELNREFWIRLVTLGGLPFLGVLAHLFPSISTFLVQWIAPSLQDMH